MATSRDAGVNAEVTYSIVGGNEGRKFRIEPDTGLVSVAGEIDHERAKEYFLTVQARDGGTPPLSNHATVNITVLDTNDNAPEFTQESYSTSLSEKSVVGSDVIAVTATDLDKGMNGVVTYRLVHGDPQNQFRVDPRDGAVSLAGVLDREMISSYGQCRSLLPPHPLPVT
jgi:protocadherin Fat 1/2/3